MSAETAHGIPRLESAPLMIPRGCKDAGLGLESSIYPPEGWYRWDGESTFSREESPCMRISQWNRLSCNTNVPWKMACQQNNAYDWIIWRPAMVGFLWLTRSASWIALTRSLCKWIWSHLRWSVNRDLSMVYLQIEKQKVKLIVKITGCIYSQRPVDFCKKK